MQLQNKVKLGNGWPYDVTRKDLIIEPVKGSGAGGQKRNKTCSGIRLTHKPTGISVRCDEERMQSQNLKIAFRKLADILIPIMKQKCGIIVLKERYGATERIRTYHEVDRRVKDERLDGQFDYVDVLQKDGLEDLIEKLINKN